MRHVGVIMCTDEHIAEILPRVRQADKDEFIAAGNMEPEEVLRRALKSSTFACTGLINGQVVAIFGVSPVSIITGRGVPWLVGTDLLEQYQFTFLRHCKPILARMQGFYPVMENYIDARNTVAKGWLHWMGFTIHDPQPYGFLGLPFHHFELRKK